MRQPRAPLAASWSPLLFLVVSIYSLESHFTAAMHATSRGPETVDGLEQWLLKHESSGPLPSREYIRRNAELALEALSAANASGEVDEPRFLRDVLPFRHLDEPVDDWRPFFYEKLRPYAVGKASLKEKAEAVIPAVFTTAFGKKLEFKSNSTPQVMAPVSETLKNGYASCTGFSILVCDALRAVGVPARVVGTAEWNLPTGGNHNWVEVWWGGAWHFTDAVPTNHVDWDKAWFVSNAQKATPGTIHGIYTAVVDPSEADAQYTLTWRDPAVKVAAEDRTRFYQQLQNGPAKEEDPSWRQYREASEGNR